jgi:hypothetical protein
MIYAAALGAVVVAPMLIFMFMLLFAVVGVDDGGNATC